MEGLMFSKYSYVLKHAAVRLVTDSLGNTVPVILTRHFEASQWAENTNKSHEQLGSATCLFQMDNEGRNAVTLSKLASFFSLKKEISCLSSKLETHAPQVLRKRWAYPWGRPHHDSGLWHAGDSAATTTYTGDLWQNPHSAYFLGCKGSHNSSLRCKHVHLKL